MLMQTRIQTTEQPCERNAIVNHSEFTMSVDNTLPWGESGSQARRGFVRSALPGRYRVRPSRREGEIVSAALAIAKLYRNVAECLRTFRRRSDSHEASG